MFVTIYQRRRRINLEIIQLSYQFRTWDISRPQRINKSSTCRLSTCRNISSWLERRSLNLKFVAPSRGSSTNSTERSITVSAVSRKQSLNAEWNPAFTFRWGVHQDRARSKDTSSERVNSASWVKNSRTESLGHFLDAEIASRTTRKRRLSIRHQRSNTGRKNDDDVKRKRITRRKRERKRKKKKKKKKWNRKTR